MALRSAHSQELAEQASKGSDDTTLLSRIGELCRTLEEDPEGEFARYPQAAKRREMLMCQPCKTGHHITTSTHEGCWSPLCPCVCNDDEMKLPELPPDQMAMSA
jgi:hypothetical protein